VVRHRARPRRLCLQQRLFYGTGGLAFGELRAETFGLSESHTKPAGPSASAPNSASRQNWSAKIEYLYVDLANSNFTITGASNGYRFGWCAPA
jgi:outer membrane immunogenic protein